jgi:hypothetical protein
VQGVRACFLIRVVDEVGDLDDVPSIGAADVDDPGVGIRTLDMTYRVDDEPNLFNFVFRRLA